MAEAPAHAPDIHPNVAEIYKAKVIRLTEALADPDLRAEAADAIRSLAGEVMDILDIVAEHKGQNQPQVITKGVAGPQPINTTKPCQTNRLAGFCFGCVARRKTDINKINHLAFRFKSLRSLSGAFKQAADSCDAPARSSRLGDSASTALQQSVHPLPDKGGDLFGIIQVGAFQQAV
ncbi:hypothetical protein [Chelativorans xinjiangense]|uniref:hypothetical protein n=1 Tax=Chelativorans xinjiangense TaxID=2681485 RepID=UPI00135A074A|nr:hypothetical protein [Chelativorans xinjiangense]